MGRHRRAGLKSPHLGASLHGCSALVKFPGRLVKHPGRIQPQVLDHEGIHRLAFGDLVAMPFLGEMGILDIRFLAEIAVDTTDIGILDLWRILGPVTTDRNQHQGTRRRQGALKLIGGGLVIPGVLIDAVIVPKNAVAVGRCRPFSWVAEVQPVGEVAHEGSVGSSHQATWQ